MFRLESTQGRKPQIARQHRSLIRLKHYKEIVANNILVLREKPVSLFYQTYSGLFDRLCTKSQSCTKSPLTCTKNIYSCTNNAVTFLRISTLLFVQFFSLHKKPPQNLLFWAKPIYPYSCTKKPSGKSPSPANIHRINIPRLPDEYCSIPLTHPTRLSHSIGGTNS